MTKKHDNSEGGGDPEDPLQEQIHPNLEIM